VPRERTNAKRAELVACALSGTTILLLRTRIEATLVFPAPLHMHASERRGGSHARDGRLFPVRGGCRSRSGERPITIAYDHADRAR
jgi:hypothetical protein